MRSPKNKKLIVGILLLVAAIGVGGKLAFDWLVADTPDVSLDEARQMVRESQAESAPLAVPAQAAATNTEAAHNQAAQPEPFSAPLISVVSSSATVGELTELLARLEVGKAKLTLAELDKKLSEIELAGAVPQVVQIPVFTENVTTAVPQASFRPSISSIQGLDGELHAVLVTSAGQQVVKKGDRLAGGERIENITANKVTIKPRNGASFDLAFED